MFEPFLLVIEAFADRLGRNYRAVYGKSDPDHAPIIRATARLALERIAGTDAVYHDLLHTLFVADVGQAILRGRAMTKAVSPPTGFISPRRRSCTTSAICAASARATAHGRYVIDASGATATAPRGSTDAFLAPWHVERGKIFVRHRCAAIPLPRCRADLPGDRADPLSGAGGRRLRRDRDRGRPGPCGRPDRSARRPGLSAQAGRPVVRAARDRADREDGLPGPGRSRRAVPALLLAARGALCRPGAAPTSRRPRRAGCGWRSSTPTCSWRSTPGAGSVPSAGRGARTAPRPVRRRRDGCAPPRVPSAGRAWS